MNFQYLVSKIVVILGRIERKDPQKKTPNRTEGKDKRVANRNRNKQISTILLDFALEAILDWNKYI